MGLPWYILMTCYIIIEPLHHYTPCCSLCSSDSNLVVVPVTYGDTYGDSVRLLMVIGFCGSCSEVMELATARYLTWQLC